MSKQVAATLCGTLLLALVAGCATTAPVAAPTTPLLRTAQADQAMPNQDQSQANQQDPSRLNQQDLSQNQAIGQLSAGCQPGQQSVPTGQAMSVGQNLSVGQLSANCQAGQQSLPSGQALSIDQGLNTNVDANVGSLSTSQPAVPAQQSPSGAMNQGW